MTHSVQRHVDVDISNELLEGRDNSVEYDFMPFMSCKNVSTSEHF